ncbi:unnamed protein product [Schistosoma rodhaini]|nr:unnamed protein product [Schistosoma rodhaini]
MVKKGNKKASKKKNLKNSNDDKIKKLEDVRRIAAVNAKLWETRVEIAEKVKDKIQERAKQLADDNARLSDALRQSERESIDVFSYLKKQNEDKDSELKELKDKIESMSISHEKDKELIIRDAKQQISCTNSEKEKKCDKIKELEREIMQLDEYKSERIRTDNEIKQLRDEVQNQKCLIENMETKFFEEKKDQKLELYQCEIEHLTEDLNKQKTIFNEQVTLQTVESSKTIENLTRTLEFERKQMIRISSLANRILQQRNEIEEFFITSLNYVRDEIKVNQNNYIHDAKSAYEASIRLAHLGKSNYPPIRTFQNKINSTNNIYDDFKIAQKIPKSTHLTIRDLTWEQKERVLSILFEKMNQSKMKLNNKINSEKSSGKNIFLNNEYGINQLNEMDPKSILYTSMNDHESNRGGQDKGEMDDNNNNNNNTNNSNNNNSNGNNNDNSNEEDSNKIVMNKSEELTKKLYEKLIKFSNHKKDQNNLTDQFDNDHEPNQRNIDSIMDDQINQTKVPYPSPQ